MDKYLANFAKTLQYNSVRNSLSFSATGNILCKLEQKQKTTSIYPSPCRLPKKEIGVGYRETEKGEEGERSYKGTDGWRVGGKRGGMSKVGKELQFEKIYYF
jgi:hypothetical protein